MENGKKIRILMVRMICNLLPFVGNVHLINSTKIFRFLDFSHIGTEDPNLEKPIKNDEQFIYGYVWRQA